MAQQQIEHNTGHGGSCPQQHFAATARTKARRKQRYWARGRRFSFEGRGYGFRLLGHGASHRVGRLIRPTGR